MKPILLFLINFLFYGIVLIVCLGLGALTLNNLPMNASPGFVARVKQYLTTNVAKTELNAAHPELELPVISASPRLLLTRIERAMVTLGWEIVEFDEASYTVTATVKSLLFRFVDDVHVELKSVGNEVEIHIESKSRLGKADFGANARHILDLLNRIDQQIELESGL